MMTQSFRKGITSDNKLMNLCEIGLFNIVWAISKGTLIIIMRFGKNNILCPKYINIYEFQGVMGGDIHGPPFIFCLLLKNEKKYKSTTYT